MLSFTTDGIVNRHRSLVAAFFWTLSIAAALLPHAAVTTGRTHVDMGFGMPLKHS